MKLTFRGRLLIGHILPVFLLVPLVGLALIYVLENNLLLPSLANEMIDQGLLVKRLTEDRPALWNSPPDAQALLDSVDLQRPTRIGLLTLDRVLLATSRPDDRVFVGKGVVNLPAAHELAAPWWAITPGDRPGEQILDVIIVANRADGQPVGLIRVYRRITDIEQSFTTMRLLVLGVLLAGLFIAAIIAIFLSESINRALKTFIHTISVSAAEGQPLHLPENVDPELAGLSRAYNQLQDRRQELEETRRQMLANVIHEIGRPLGSLRTALHALQTGAVNNQPLRTDLMQGMAERIDRMGRLLEDLALTYQGLEPQEIHVQSIQVSEWLDSLAPIWAEAAQQKQLVWEMVLPDDLPVMQTDPDRLAQALGNLVSNAIKFTPTGGKITLTVDCKENKIHILVSDNGIGIPLADQSHLFVPFYRSIQPSWKAPGLGLGLSIAKSIVESLGGRITLVSAPGQGSTFMIILPVQ
jgi:signal transduction histidine kinase